uniref:Uncharacterized protein n=1 Tax=Arundo donax TaxID=35708 RepID=A0A0A9DWB0_ARUDO
MSTTVPAGPSHLGGSSVVLLTRYGCGRSSSLCTSRLACRGSALAAAGLLALGSASPGPFFRDLKKSSTFLSSTSPLSLPPSFLLASGTSLSSSFFSSSKKTRPLSASEGGPASAGTKALSRDWCGKYFFSRR